MAEISTSQQERPLIEGVSAERLMDSVRAVAQWVRLAGTPEEARAFDYLEDQLRESGAEVHRYAFPALVSWPESAALAVAAGEGWESILCGTQSFSATTPPEGLEGDLVYVGRGTEEELRKADVAGKIALVDGIIGPHLLQPVEAAGAAGSIWIAGARLHEGNLSPVWGTPTPETAHLLPKTPTVSVIGTDGARLKEKLKQGPVRVKIQTKVFTGWKDIPVLTGDVWPAVVGPDSDTFVLLSGHVDSWYLGAMDNGTSNATLLEVARLLAGARSQLRRGLRVAFWSGHSHGRYAGSAWYADNFWQELHDRCIAHINCDSPGAKGAKYYSGANCMAEVRDFASDAIELIVGQRLDPSRYGRAGDQSFWGHGIPAMLMAMSRPPAADSDPVLVAHHSGLVGAKGKGSAPWWWHRSEDTVDKIDPEVLRKDATIYMLLAYRLCTFPILPFDYLAFAAETKATVEGLAAKSGEHFDFQPISDQLATLESALEKLQAKLAEAAKSSPLDERVVGVANCCLMELGRDLIPVDYTRSGLFDQDLAVPSRSLPSLQPAAKLAAMDPISSEYHFLRTRLTRERNRVVHGLVEATRAVERALADL